MHGDLDNVYKTLQYLETVHNTKIDLLLCCGDFQVFVALNPNLSITMEVVLPPTL